MQFTGPSEPSQQEQTLCAAVAATTKVPSRGKAKLEFSLCWDNPVVHFGSAKIKHYRYHKLLCSFTSAPIWHLCSGKMLANTRAVLYQMYMLLGCMREFILLGMTVSFSLNLLVNAVPLRKAEQFAVRMYFLYVIKTLIIHKGESKGFVCCQS